MMTRKFFTTVAAMGSLLLTMGFSPWTKPCSAAMILGDPVALSTLLAPGATMTVGDKTFSAFGYTFTGNMPAPSLVNVVPIQDDDGNFGIRFQGAFIDLPSSPGGSDALITYMVEAGPGRLISDAHLIGNPNVLGDLGSISVTETFLPLGPGGEYTMEIFDDENLDTALLVDWVDFVPPVKKLSVQKDILAIAIDTANSVTLSMVDQTFSQIPEPITTISLVTGAIAVGLARRARGARRTPA
jgi:hypothetical protein